MVFLEPGDSTHGGSYSEGGLHSNSATNDRENLYSAVSFAARTIVTKGEDRFACCSDLRPWHGERSPPPGSVVATYAVFDGHLGSLAAAHCEKHWMETVRGAIEKEKQKTDKDYSTKGRRPSRATEELDLESALARAVRDVEESFWTNKKDRRRIG